MRHYEDGVGRKDDSCGIGAHTQVRRYEDGVGRNDDSCGIGAHTQVRHYEDGWTWSRDTEHAIDDSCGIGAETSSAATGWGLFPLLRFAV